MKPFLLTSAAVVIALLLLAPWTSRGWAARTASSQETPPSEPNLREEIAALKEGQEDIRRQLLEIKQLLQRNQRPAAGPRVPDVNGKAFDLGENSVKGSDQATVALLEFTDYQCPFCSRHFLQTHPLIERNYVDTGKIRYVSLDLPIPSLHPLAFKAAEASHCAKDQGRFWEMHDRLFKNQKALEPWISHAEALGLDVAQFEDCLSTGKHREAIRRDMSEASKAGASGTPSFVVGVVDSQDPKKVVGLKFIRGAQPYATFQQALDEALALGSAPLEERKE